MVPNTLLAQSGADVPHLFKKGSVNLGGAGAKLAVLVKLNKGQRLGILAGGAGQPHFAGTSREGDRMTSGGGGGSSSVFIMHRSASCPYSVLCFGAVMPGRGHAEL